MITFTDQHKRHATIGLLGLSVLFIAGAVSFPLVWSPPTFPVVKASVEQLVEQIANRQRESLELRDQFIEFRAKDPVTESDFLMIDWNTEHRDLFHYEASVRSDGVLRIRAIPKPDALSQKLAPAQAYFQDIGLDGSRVSAAWFPKHAH